MDEEFLKQMQSELDQLNSKNYELSNALAATSYQGKEDANLIQFQIDTGEMLSKIEHFLRGEYVAVDEEGNEYWKKSDDKNLALLNDYGVNFILSILGNYLDKNTILSWYDEMRINEILADLGDKLAEEIYFNYEKIGLTTEYKKSRYPLIVLTILHAVESAYRRALRGKTLEGLNSSKIVAQTESINPNILNVSNKRKFNLFKPSTW